MRYPNTFIPKLVALIALIGISISDGYAQVGPPDMTCVQVNPANGNVTVNWNPPADPNGEFSSYQMYAATNANGTFLQLTSTVNNINQTSYTMPISTGNTTQMCFYIQSNGIDGSGNPYVSAPSDTICSIYVTAQPFASNNGFANIHWTNPYVNSVTPPGTTFQLMMEYPAGQWNLLNTFGPDETSYLYEVYYCQANLNFQVFCTDPSGCQMVSNIDGDAFENSNEPDIPIVTSVEFNAAGDAVITWLPSDAPDIDGYIVYLQGTNGSSEIFLDTIYTTQYIHLTANPLGAITYGVAAFDTCSAYASSPSATDSTWSRPVRLLPPGYSICDDRVQLSWEPYFGWWDGIESYVIYRSTDNINFTSIDTVAGNITAYSDFDLQFNQTAYYYVKAIANLTGWTARSNVNAVLVSYPVGPGFTYLTSASVTAPNEVTVTVETTTTGTELTTYMLQKERRNEIGVWDNLYPLSNSAGTTLQFVDTDVATDVFSYNYRVVVFNTCDQPIDTTNTGMTILLSGIADNNVLSNLMKWSAYSNWPQGVVGYRLYRKEGIDGTYSMIQEWSNNRFFEQDDVSALYQSSGQFCYQIEAFAYGFPLAPASVIARSNEVCLTQTPKIWIPNSFIYDSVVEARRTFGPVYAFAEVKSYSLIVYSRWGDIVYESASIDEPWDGTMHGNPVEEGVYAYFMHLEDGSGKPYDFKGTVLMLKGREE
jgi:CHU_C Type IX secretion signal domain